MYLNISSVIKTTAQDETATPNKPTPKYESKTPAINAITPEITLSVV